MTAGITTTELEAMISRCLAGYADAKTLKVTVMRLAPDTNPNWDYSVEYEGRDIAGAGDVLVREIAGLKHRFHLLAE